MDYNRDYRAILKRGKWIECRTIQEQQESGAIVALCVVLCMAIVLMGIVFGGAM